MRKEYMAPDLYFESFVLSESIAACSLKELTESLRNEGKFTSDLSCSDITGYEEYCYWSYSSMTSTYLFSS